METTKERLTVKELRDYLNNLDPVYDDASVAIIKPGDEKTILREEIVYKPTLNLVLSPTKDKERQAMLTVCSREDSKEIEKIYNKVRNGEEN